MERFGGSQSLRQDDRMELSGGGRGIGLAGRGQGGIGGTGVGPLTLVEGAKKLLQDVSGVEPTRLRLDRIPAFLSAPCLVTC
jgi:hypothetical protein